MTKQAKWYIENRYIKREDGSNYYSGYNLKCNNCNSEALHYDDDYTSYCASKYCPECGCRMTGVEKEERCILI